MTRLSACKEQGPKLLRALHSLFRAEVSLFCETRGHMPSSRDAKRYIEALFSAQVTKSNFIVEWKKCDPLSEDCSKHL